MLTRQSIDIDTAEAVIAAASTHATQMGVPQNIAIVDEAGHLVAFRRMDGAKFFPSRSPSPRPSPRWRPATEDIGPAFLAGARCLPAATTLPGGIPLSSLGGGGS